MVDLYHRTRGEGEDIVLLHGLFGSADNVGMLARGLENQYRVTSFDLRDHGRSPHTQDLSYQAMALDIKTALEKLNIHKCHIFGHSMGGKVAMTLAAIKPDLVASLIIGDIAPVYYEPRHMKVLAGQEAISRLPLLPDREGAEKILNEYINDEMVLKFLMTNWRRQTSGWSWRHNLDLIVKDYEKISAIPPKGLVYHGKTLFLKGENSDYIQANHKPWMDERFSQLSLRTLAGTGHWFHAEKTDMTLRIIKRFLQDL